MRNILITGIARGLGKSLSNYLLERDCFVYGTTRNVESVQPSKNLKLFYLDLTDNNSIDKVANYFIESGEILDAIVHNSGVAYLDPADVLDDKESRHIFDVNFFGPLYLTKKLLPILRKQSKTNLIFISSIVSVDHWPYLGIYAASKAALEAVAFEWAVLLKKWNIYVSVIQPNPLPTDMQILRSKNAKNSPYSELNERSLKWEKIVDVCALIEKILEDKSPEFLYQTGSFSKKAIQCFLKANAYQKAVERYQKTYLK
jgi:NAD(P)-dependent dehydrogenase (short-subunit alcohol dehydrogenase family)